MTLQILTICTGNVCRSPLAAQLLTNQLDPTRFEIASAGTSALIGDHMPEPAQRIATRLGLKGATTHRAAALTEHALASADLILAMDREHRSHAAQMLPTVVRRSFTLLEFAHIVTHLEPSDAPLEQAMRMRGVVPRLSSGRQYDVEDPYGRSKQVYERSTKQILRAVDDIVQFLNAHTISLPHRPT